MKKILIILFLISAFLIYLLFFHKSPLEKVIDKSIKLVAEENIHELMGIVSKNFKGEDQMTHGEMKEILEEIFKIFDHIKIIIEKMEKSPARKDNIVQVALHYKVIANHRDQRGYIAGGPMDTSAIVLWFKKENGEWKILRASGYKLKKSMLKEMKSIFY